MARLQRFVNHLGGEQLIVLSFILTVMTICAALISDELRGSLPIDIEKKVFANTFLILLLSIPFG